MSLPAPIESRREFHIDASPIDLWPLISNTNRMNRAIGLPAVRVDGDGGGDGFAKAVSARLGPLRVTWKEPPFEWVEGRFFTVLRIFDGGPAERISGRVELVPEGAGCRFVITEEVVPRGGLWAPACRLMAGRIMNRVADAVRGFEASLKNAAIEPFVGHRAKTAPDAASLRARAAQLASAPIDSAASKRLLAHLEHGYDDQLHAMRPFELADRWGLDRLNVLKAFLHAVKTGLVDMSWDVLCPNCAAPKESLGSLTELKASSHCDGCGITYGVDFDECVELRFAVSPLVRPLNMGVFCVGNPSQTPFAAAQLLLRGEPRTVEADLFSESYALRDLGAKKRVWLRPSAQGSARVEADLSRLEDGAELKFKPGTVALTIRGAGGSPALLRLERASWKEKAARASIVTALQEFRRLFSSEVLAPGLEIGVKTVTVLFSDLKDSTALYEKVGDATAYALVRDHFDYLFAIIAEKDGAVVKTIGDAVMAVFSVPQRAVAAALEMQERVGELNAKLAPKPPVILKLGIHQGPAIAINANGVLDYFGTTVNAAARVQNESKGGDLVLTRAVREEPAVAALLKDRGASEQPFRIRLKGLSEDYELVRLLPRSRR